MPNSELSDFLVCVSLGDQSEVERMLQQSSELASLHGDLIDCAGREFTHITGFQYALWALDWHMYKMIKEHLLPSTIEDQIEELNSAAWTIAHGTTISWRGLVKGIEEYKSNYNRWSRDERKEQWCRIVGREQKFLPAHVIQEYSRSDRSFYSRPNFYDVNVFSRDVNPVKSWYKLPSIGDLGTDFAWATKENGGCCPRGYGSGYDLSGTVWDGEVLENLFQIRMSQHKDIVNVIYYYSKHKQPLSLPPTNTVITLDTITKREEQKKIEEKNNLKIQTAFAAFAAGIGGLLYSYNSKNTSWLNSEAGVAVSLSALACGSAVLGGEAVKGVKQLLSRGVFKDVINVNIEVAPNLENIVGSNAVPIQFTPALQVKPTVNFGPKLSLLKLE